MPTDPDTPTLVRCLNCGSEQTQQSDDSTAPHSPPGTQSARCLGSGMPPESGDTDLDAMRRDALEMHSAAVARRERLEEDTNGLTYVAALDYRAADIAEAEYLVDMWSQVIRAGTYWTGVRTAFAVLLARRPEESRPLGRALDDARQLAARAFLRSVRRHYLDGLLDTGREADALLASLWFDI